MSRFARILVATDFSSASMPALEHAIRLSKDSGAQLLIANAVAEFVPPEIGYASASGYEQWRRDAREAAEKKLQPLVEQARREGLDARPLVLAGLPDEAIVEAAGREGADLIVLGTHGRRGADRFLLGSVASRVVLAAECPVLTVRPPQPGPPGVKAPA